MGRQMAVSLTEDEEAEFLAFLRDSADIQVLQGFAERERDLFVDRFALPSDGHLSYYIWNRAFSWEPAFAQTRLDLPEPERRGRYYISNKDSGPILEYSRAVPDAHHLVPGRIYWSKHFSAPNGLGYDVAGFEAWYESVVRWLKRCSRRQAKRAIRAQ